MDHPVVLFDGVCNLCNRMIDFLIRRDRSGSLRYGTLQGETAKSLAPEFAQTDGLSTMVYLEDGKTYVRSGAVAMALRKLGGFWGILGAILFAVPRPVRDWGYRLIARNRMRWFGQRDSCRLPTEAERMLFLP